MADYGLSHMLERLQNKARLIKTEVYALYLAYSDPRTPWYARIFAICVVGYAFSPIDLIPDPIPVLGYVDDLVLIPLGILLALKMIPKDVMDEYRGRARAAMIQRQPVNWVAASVIVGIWLGLAILTVAIVTKYLNT